MRRTILVDNETGEPLAVGDMVKLLATPAAELIHISYPGDEGLEGRVHLRNKGAHADRIFFPSTIGAHFIEKA
jgi:hypothetical protein